VDLNSPVSALAAWAGQIRLFVVFTQINLTIKVIDVFGSAADWAGFFLSEIHAPLRRVRSRFF
jgi:hypothetical protein